MLIFEVNGTSLCAYSLHLRSLIDFLCFRREGLDLKVLSLRETKFDLRDNLSHGVILLLRMSSSP